MRRRCLHPIFCVWRPEVLQGVLSGARSGSIAWRALLRSAVPVLVRHVEEGIVSHPEPAQRRILVPLDGSTLAEKALPLATELAAEWRAPLYLVRVVPDPVTAETIAVEAADDPEAAKGHLDAIANRLPGSVQASVLTGSVVEALVEAVDKETITDIVMTSHGRTGLSRVIVGEVADELIHRLHCPIVVIPPLMTLAAE